MAFKIPFVFTLLFLFTNAYAELSLEQARSLEIKAGADPNAVEEVRKYAESGDARGEFLLGTLHWQGIGMPKNDSEAFNWFNKSAKHGDKWAMYNLGYLFYYGQGVETNFSQAAYWWTKASDQGFAPAQNSLASLYEQGKGVLKSQSKKIELLRKAANKNLGLAQTSLGVCYGNGEGVEHSLVIAHAILSIAVLDDKLNAPLHLAKYSGRMSSEELNQAKKLSEEMMRKDNFLNALDTFISTKNN